MFNMLLSRGMGLRDAGRSWLGKGFENLPSPPQVDRMIVRETARAERNGQHFSVVLFRVKGGRSGGGRRAAVSERRLARALLRRIRLTDEVGWFDDRNLCALLTDTPAGGARVFADGVCDEIARKAPRPKYQIYTYPDHGPNNDGPKNGRDHHNGKSNGSSRITALLGERANAGDSFIAMPAAESMSRPPGPRGPEPAVHSLHALLTKPVPFWKRAIDVVGATVGLILLLPLFAVVAAWIKLTSPGAVMFTQKRSGLGGRPFKIYKFRTMCVDAEAKKQALRHKSEQDGPAFKLKNDPRVTRIGNILRKSSIDELPQLWNVLKGDMSLVGPRPLPVDESNGCETWQKRRLDVTPGLTCIWQIEGRSQVTFAEWVRMDVKYMRRLNILHDLSILFKTVPAVLLRRGAR
jgi:lipopolysaccharide/colanic/teichoic acid biosynthesis glycosyltransferase